MAFSLLLDVMLILCLGGLPSTLGNNLTRTLLVDDVQATVSTISILIIIVARAIYSYSCKASKAGGCDFQLKSTFVRSLATDVGGGCAHF